MRVISERLGSPAGVFRAIGFVVHVLGLEEAEQMRRVCGIDRLQLRLVPDIRGTVALAPRGEKIAPVEPLAGQQRIFRIALIGRHELGAPAAERDVDAAAERKLDELAREIDAIRRALLFRNLHVGFPIAIDDCVRRSPPVSRA